MMRDEPFGGLAEWYCSGLENRRPLGLWVRILHPPLWRHFNPEKHPPSGFFFWRAGRVAEGARLLSEYRVLLYRGFESLALR